MKFGLKQWPAAWGMMTDSLYRLLSPDAKQCLVCGKAASFVTPELKELCISCYRDIPWIVEPRCLVCGRPTGCPDCHRPNQAGRHFVLNRSCVAYNPAMREWLAMYKYRGHEAYGRILSSMMGRAVQLLVEELRGQPYRQGDKFLQQQQPLYYQGQQHYGYTYQEQSHSYRFAQREFQLHQHQLHPRPLKNFPWSYRNGRGCFYFDMVTYVPLSEERMYERGFNQAERLAEAVAAQLEAYQRNKVPVVELLCRARHTEKQSLKGRQARIRDMLTAFEPAPEAMNQLRGIVEQQSMVSNKGTKFLLQHDRLIGRRYHWSCGWASLWWGRLRSTCRGKVVRMARGSGQISNVQKDSERSVRILLVDDVYTTGSTINVCAGILKDVCHSAGMTGEIYSLTWARS